MEIAIRYHVHNKPPKGAELSDAAKKNFTGHKFSRGDRMTGCGTAVPENDVRWKIDRDGKDSDINCSRCLHPKAAPGERKSKAKAGGKAKPKKAAKKKAATPAVGGTAVPKGRMAELKKRARSKQAAGSTGSTVSIEEEDRTSEPFEEAPEPEYDPVAEHGLHEELPRSITDAAEHE